MTELSALRLPILVSSVIVVVVSSAIQMAVAAIDQVRAAMDER